MSTQPQTQEDTSRVLQRLNELEQRVEDLEDTVEQREDHIKTLEDEKAALQERVSDLEEDVDMNFKRTRRNYSRISEAKDRVGELQSRELEKGAHLLESHIDAGRLSVAGDRIERFEGDDGEDYARLPGEADPLQRSGTSQLAQGDLLPIQQLARLDEDMLQSTADALPVRLAAKVWSERQHNNPAPWSKGSSEVRHYIDSSDLRHWIRSEQNGVSEAYAKKLAQRTMDAVEDLAKDRVYSKARTRRKDGLQYKERRLILPSDSEIPGERES